MNNFNMECQDCGKTFTVKYNDKRWGKARCEACLFKLQMDPHAVMNITITKKGWEA